MALRLSVSSSHGPASSPAISTCRPAACGRFPALLGGGVASQRRSLTVVSGPETRAVIPVRSSGSDTATVGAEAEAVAVTGQVTEVNKDTFWPIVKSAGPKVVVLDMYTQWYFTKATKLH
jgi:thioredoxin 1